MSQGQFVQKMLNDRHANVKSVEEIAAQIAAQADEPHVKANVEEQVRGLLNQWNELSASAAQRTKDLEANLGGFTMHHTHNPFFRQQDCFSFSL